METSTAEAYDPGAFELNALPEAICFKYGAECRQHRSVSLTNSGGRRVAIKIKTTSRNAIKVDVAYRFLDPGRSTVVYVLRLPERDSWHEDRTDRISFYYVAADYTEEFAIDAYRKEQQFKRETVKIIYVSDSPNS